VIPQRLIDRYAKILARAQAQNNGAEADTARKILLDMERKHPGLRNAYIANKAAQAVAQEAKRATRSAAAAAATMARGTTPDPVVEAVRRTVEARGEDLIDRGIAQAEKAFSDFLDSWMSPDPSQPPQARRSAGMARNEKVYEILDEEASFELSVDEEDGMIELTMDLPYEAWDKSPKTCLTWIRESIDEGLDELLGGDDEDEDEDSEDEDSEDED